MPYNLTRFSFSDMMDCRTRIRSLLSGDVPTISAGAGRLVDFFYDELRDDQGERACALVRFFKTHLYRDLNEELQRYADRMIPADVNRDPMRCLTLLATRGVEPDWNDPARSRGHRAIPLHSIEMVESAPMIAQLIQQTGLSIADVVRPQPGLLLNRDETKYNVFYVPQAAGNPYIVAQNDFVVPYKIASVLGFGGLLATGDMFAIIMFSRVPIPSDVAEQFKIVGLNMKIAVLTLVGRPLFA